MMDAGSPPNGMKTDERYCSLCEDSCCPLDHGPEELAALTNLWLIPGRWSRVQQACVALLR
jgi:hypothetical protein